MRRGDAWTVRGEPYATKARPSVVVQDDDLSQSFDSVVLVPLTTFLNPVAATRVKVEPSAASGLGETSYAMTEKPFTVRRERLGGKIGAVTRAEAADIARALARVLAITAEDLR
jgi:mRNA interferase MazF